MERNRCLKETRVTGVLLCRRKWQTKAEEGLPQVCVGISEWPVPWQWWGLEPGDIWVDDDQAWHQAGCLSIVGPFSWRQYDSSKGISSLCFRHSSKSTILTEVRMGCKHSLKRDKIQNPHFIGPQCLCSPQSPQGYCEKEEELRYRKQDSSQERSKSHPG